MIFRLLFDIAKKDIQHAARRILLAHRVLD